MTDELERLRQFRADEPPVSPEVTRAAREALQAAISAGAEVQGARSPRLGRQGPPPRRGSQGPPPRGAHGSPLPRRRWWQRRRILGVAAAACLAALVALAVTSGSTSSTTAAAAVLERLAQVAEHQNAVTPPAAGRYLYVDSLQSNEALTVGRAQQCVALVPERRQIWIRADGAGRLLETTGEPSYTSAHDRAVCAQMHALSGPGTSDSWFAPRCLTLGLASALPPGSLSDPAALLREMRRLDGGPRTPAEDFVHIGDFLRESDDSPALRAAIYRAAATIPGVRLLGLTADHLGRRGIGIGYASHGSLSELIFDPNTSALLGEQTVDTANRRATEWAAYRESRIVARIPGSGAPRRLGPPCVNGAGYVHIGPGGASLANGAPVKP